MTAHTGLEHISCVPFPVMANSVFGTVYVVTLLQDHPVLCEQFVMSHYTANITNSICL
jgi:hypothetical protein